MLMNKLEFFAMNNPMRALIQEILEVKTLRKFSQLPQNKKVLEIGCGNGTGTKLIKKYFRPKSITAIDLDERMIHVARQNNSDPSILYRYCEEIKYA
ncbi:MAG: class I SAM-dependent methyltransferase [Candidatus Levybacteria bacterium]|nr:class I SAM-dependent methyltransferase [Candidatus Levybacteria bacterium]